MPGASVRKARVGSASRSDTLRRAASATWPAAAARPRRCAPLASFAGGRQRPEAAVGVGLIGILRLHSHMAHLPAIGRAGFVGRESARRRVTRRLAMPDARRIGRLGRVT